MPAHDLKLTQRNAGNTAFEEVTLPVPSGLRALTMDETGGIALKQIGVVGENGKLDPALIPDKAIDIQIEVDDQAARYALTTESVQNGDVAKQLDNETFWLVINENKLDRATGWQKISAPDWTEIQNKPETFTPSAHATEHTPSGTDPLSPSDIGAVAEQSLNDGSLNIGDTEGTGSAMTVNPSGVAGTVDQYAPTIQGAPNGYGLTLLGYRPNGVAGTKRWFLNLGSGNADSNPCFRLAAQNDDGSALTSFLNAARANGGALSGYQLVAGDTSLWPNDIVNMAISGSLWVNGGLNIGGDLTQNIARIVHVASNGTDTRSGISKYSFLKPFATIQAALNTASAGDLVWVHPGIYNERITLKNGVNIYGDLGAVITFTSTQTNQGIVTDGGSNVTCRIDGLLTFDFTSASNYYSWGFYFTGNSNIDIRCLKTVQHASTGTMIPIRADVGGTYTYAGDMIGDNGLIHLNFGSSASWSFKNGILAVSGSGNVFSLNGTGSLSFDNCVMSAGQTVGSINNGSLNLTKCSLNATLYNCLFLQGNTKILVDNCTLVSGERTIISEFSAGATLAIKKSKLTAAANQYVIDEGSYGAVMWTFEDSTFHVSGTTNFIVNRPSYNGSVSAAILNCRGNKAFFNNNPATLTMEYLTTSNL